MSSRTRKLEKKLLRQELDQELNASLPTGVRGAVGALPGMRKLSEELLELVAPYREEAETDEAIARLIALGALAWNLALLPPDAEERAMREQVEATLRGGEAAAARALLGELIARKRRHFADDRRRIVSYQIADVGPEFRLLVASAFAPPR